MAIHSSILAWRIPGTGEPGGLSSMGSHRVGHNWSDSAAAAAGLTVWDIFEGFSKNNVFWTICENYFSQLASLTSFWLFYWLACLLLCFLYTWKVIFVFLELLSGCEISQVVSSHRWGEYDLHWRQQWTDPVREESQFSSFFLSFFFFFLNFLGGWGTLLRQLLHLLKSLSFLLKKNSI